MSFTPLEGTSVGYGRDNTGRYYGSIEQKVLDGLTIKGTLDSNRRKGIEAKYNDGNFNVGASASRDPYSGHNAKIDIGYKWGGNNARKAPRSGPEFINRNAEVEESSTVVPMISMDKPAEKVITDRDRLLASLFRNKGAM